MKSTYLLRRQHQILVSLASALENERFCRAAILRDFADELERHLAAEERLLVEYGASPSQRAGLDASREQLRRLVASMRANVEDDDAFARIARTTRVTVRSHAALYERDLFDPLEPALPSLRQNDVRGAHG